MAAHYTAMEFYSVKTRAMYKRVNINVGMRCFRRKYYNNIRGNHDFSRVRKYGVEKITRRLSRWLDRRRFRVDKTNDPIALCIKRCHTRFLPRQQSYIAQRPLITYTCHPGPTPYDDCKFVAPPSP